MLNLLDLRRDPQRVLLKLFIVLHMEKLGAQGMKKQIFARRRLVEVIEVIVILAPVVALTILQNKQPLNLILQFILLVYRYKLIPLLLHPLQRLACLIFMMRRHCGSHSSRILLFLITLTCSLLLLDLWRLLLLLLKCFFEFGEIL